MIEKLEYLLKKMSQTDQSEHTREDDIKEYVLKYSLDELTGLYQVDFVRIAKMDQAREQLAEKVGFLEDCVLAKIKAEALEKDKEPKL